MYSFHTSVVNNGLRAVHVYCRQIARFLCVCLGQRGRLFWGQIRQNAEAKTEIRLPSTDRALYSHKARSFNQSERALYRNFVIICHRLPLLFLILPCCLLQHHLMCRRLHLNTRNFRHPPNPFHLPGCFLVAAFILITFVFSLLVFKTVSFAFKIEP